MKKKYLFFITLCILFFSCKMGIKNSKPSVVQNGDYVTVSGQIINSLSRSILPQNLNFTSYKVYAVSEGADKEIVNNGEVTDKTYSINLNKEKVWVITVEGCIDGYSVLCGSINFDPSSIETQDTSILLNTICKSENEVTINLKVSSEGNIVKKCSWGYYDLLSDNPEAFSVMNEMNISSGTLNFGLTPGIYDVVFRFLTTSNYEVYYIKTTVYVLDHQTITDWGPEVKNEHNFTGDSLYINKKMARNCLSNCVYVSSFGDDNNNGNIFSPVRTFKQAIYLLEQRSSVLNELGYSLSLTDNPATIFLLTDYKTTSSYDLINSSLAEYSVSENLDSVLISGYGETKKINLDKISRAFTIKDGFKVQLKNLDITNGNSDDGGALYLSGDSSTAEVYLSENTKISSCTATKSGNLIFGTGKFKINLDGGILQDASATGNSVVMNKGFINIGKFSADNNFSLSISGDSYSSSAPVVLDLNKFNYDSTMKEKVNLKLSSDFESDSLIVSGNSNLAQELLELFKLEDGKTLVADGKNAKLNISSESIEITNPLDDTITFEVNYDSTTGVCTITAYKNDTTKLDINSFNDINIQLYKGVYPTGALAELGAGEDSAKITLDPSWPDGVYTLYFSGIYMDSYRISDMFSITKVTN